MWIQPNLRASTSTFCHSILLGRYPILDFRSWNCSVLSFSGNTISSKHLWFLSGNAILNITNNRIRIRVRKRSSILHRPPIFNLTSCYWTTTIISPLLPKRGSKYNLINAYIVTNHSCFRCISSKSDARRVRVTNEKISFTSYTA